MKRAPESASRASSTAQLRQILSQRCSVLIGCGKVSRFSLTRFKIGQSISEREISEVSDLGSNQAFSDMISGETCAIKKRERCFQKMITWPSALPFMTAVVGIASRTNFPKLRTQIRSTNTSTTRVPSVNSGSPNSGEAQAHAEKLDELRVR